MIWDCIVIGGGPAGLNAALVLGRSRRLTLLFDDNQPRNRVTNESHGFITRDGITPEAFRAIGYQELTAYPSINIQRQRVVSVTKQKDVFTVTADDASSYYAKTVILATGYKDVLPDIPAIHDYYGRSLFSCPFCDGWELRDQALVVIADNDRAFHFAQVVYNWSSDLIVCTNGHQVVTEQEKVRLQEKSISLYEQPIVALSGSQGQLTSITLADQTQITRNGGFIAANWEPATSFAKDLGCEFNQQGGIKTDDLGHTTVAGLLACGDVSIVNPSQLVIAAAEGSKAAIAVNAQLINKSFN
ncbi:NAD(P)/FAD-dependent oxidoreductase [uncultured Vagococcus sp.]|uniref:NAD(P)/FAD-dependent oxidoreductase n=1 Tax=uncultured Vagococcus sp. TaxID=189676 RepID=UPI0028D4BB0D|nr:NAD(P)/FAD-dependent oxidoreductase [uncultured Vagococcus sp.]